MTVKIDWLSWSMPMVLMTHTDESYALCIERAFHDMFGARLTAEVLGGKWDDKKAKRAPYKDSWEKVGTGLSMYASRELNHMLVEVSGNGCDYLRREGVLETVLANAADRMTRIDIAVDLETDTDPMDFASMRTNGRIEAIGDYKSASGRTVYVGSQKSERFCRVYRYNAPHPRSHLLRVEMVFRRAGAKSVAKALCASSDDMVAADAGDYYGWYHPTWQLRDGDASKITPVSSERNMGKTVFWLVKQVAPAFKRAVSEGVIIDPVKFLTDYFLEKDDLTK